MTEPSSTRDRSIKAILFDMDGTLADTERLKARAYTDIVSELLETSDPDPRVLPLYGAFVGSTDRALCEEMVEQFGLSEILAPHVERLGVSAAWEALHTMRMDHYHKTYGRPEIIAQNAFRHSVDLVREHSAAGRIVAVATSSFTGEATRVLKAIGVLDLLQAVVGRDQVSQAKPHPEIYLKTAEILGVAPSECVVIEDSPMGAKSALAAEMACLIIANQFTGGPLRAFSEIDQRWVAYDPAEAGMLLDLLIEELEGSA